MLLFGYTPHLDSWWLAQGLVFCCCLLVCLFLMVIYFRQIDWKIGFSWRVNLFTKSFHWNKCRSCLVCSTTKDLLMQIVIRTWLEVLQAFPSTHQVSSEPLGPSSTDIVVIVSAYCSHGVHRWRQVEFCWGEEAECRNCKAKTRPTSVNRDPSRHRRPGCSRTSDVPGLLFFCH